MSTTTLFRALDAGMDVETITASKTLTAGDSGKTFLVATDALVITLPSAAVAGLEYTFINTGADGAAIITISPLAADGIAGLITLAASVVNLSGTVDKDLINTKATSITGNAAKIVSSGTTGVTGWLVVSSSGIWASE
jgi:hypothetical protein